MTAQEGCFIIVKALVTPLQGPEKPNKGQRSMDSVSVLLCHFFPSRLRANSICSNMKERGVSILSNAKKRILVINDTQVILEMFQMILEEEGYEVILSSFPLQKVEQIVELQPDVVILDLIFGGEVSGWQMLQLLKMQQATATLPVIVCTAATQTVKEMEGYLLSKGVRIVLKPFDVAELLDAIEKLLREHPHTASSVRQENPSSQDNETDE